MLSPSGEFEILHNRPQPSIRDIDTGLVPTGRLRIPADVANVGICFQRGRRLEMVPNWWSMVIE